MMAKPEKQHEWLKQFVGNWTSEAEVSSGPDKPSEVSRGTETARMVGDLWMIAEGKASMPGVGEGTMILTLGYDPAKGKFIGTWIGSMMTQMWVYEGTLEGNTLTLDTEGPNMAVEGKTSKYRETIVIKSHDERTFSSSMLGDDGKWITFMNARYIRVK